MEQEKTVKKEVRIIREYDVDNDVAIEESDGNEEKKEIED